MKVAASHIKKRYAGRNILHDCSFAFSVPGTYVLMGGNGSGKSTLLRIMALLEEPDSGEITFCDGKNLLSPDLALRRRITLVLPRIGLFNTTVEKNVAYGLSLRGIKESEAGERIVQALSFVGLEQKRDQHALTLSSGESQRLGIARALVLAPEILFLDEPTASIDEENTGIIESIIKTMKQQGTSMVIMTTHDRAQAERLADHMLLLKQGKLEAAF